MLLGRRYLCRAKVLPRGKDGTDGHTPVLSEKKKRKPSKQSNQTQTQNNKQTRNLYCSLVKLEEFTLPCD